MAKRDIKAKRWERRRLKKAFNGLLRGKRLRLDRTSRWLRASSIVLQAPELNRRALMALNAIIGNSGGGE